MKPLKSHYPEFVPNQILTNTQLNQLRDHLDQQGQWTRVRLVGTGIVCGLTWSLDDAGRIVLAAGYGVTSDGQLVEHGATTFTHAVKYEDPGVDEDGDLEYAPWRDANGEQIELLELLDADAVAAHDETQPPPQPLDAALLQDRVLVLYLERRPVQLRSCIVTDCNNTGVNIHLEVRALLVPRDHLDALADAPPSPAQERLPRFHTCTALTDLGSAADVDATWSELVQAALPGLAGSVRTAFGDYGPFLDLDVDVGSRLQELEQFIHAAAAANALHQSHHDLLKDLADALNEAVAAACELAAECCPESTFPRHLMLGDLNGADPFGAGAYRHEFRPAPARDVLRGDLERTRRLFLRLAAMLDARDPQAFDRAAPAAPVGLTPSRTEAEPLGRRAVPRIYTLTPKLERHWQPRLRSTTEPLWSYHRPGDLATDAGRATFLRVEGHLGRSRGDAVDGIGGQRWQHNVPFAILGARFGDPASEWEPFHASLESLLEKRGLHLAALEKVLFESARDGALTLGEIADRVRDTSEVDRNVAEEIAGQLTRLRDFEPWCDPAAILAGYRAARGELSCRLHRLLGELGKTPNYFDPTAYQPGDLAADRARVMLADRRGARLLAIGEAQGDVDAAVQALAGEIAALTADVAPWVLLPPAAEALRISIDHLLRHLAESPDGLGVEVLLERVRAVAADALYYWLLWKASDALPSNLPVGIGKEDDPGDWVLPVLGASLPARLVELALAYEAVRRRDLGWFTNLAQAHEGLEHRGGVEPGGTFVLVVDGDDKVTADFSLPFRPPCCCEIDPPAICGPPLALPDHRVVLLRRDTGSEGFLPIELEIDVLANDSDPNAPGRKDDLTITLDATVTPLGGEIETPTAGVVRYRHGDPRPGCVDRFRYTLRLSGDTCSGEAAGDVLILTVAEPEPKPGTIIGRVASADDAAPIEGAVVRIDEIGAQTTTDEEGRYVLADVPDGVYPLQASHPDFAGGTRTAVVPAGETVAVDFALEPKPAPGAITGRVASAADDAPLAGAGVRIEETGEETTTDAEGRYLFADVPEGVYHLQASHADFLSATQTAAVHEGKASAVDFALEPKPAPGAITGRVASAVDGVALVGARVQIEETGEEKTTDGDGRYRFEAEPERFYHLRASQGGYLSATETAAVYEGETVEVDFALEPVPKPEPGTITGRVASTTGALLVGASVEILETGDATGTNEEGVYTFEVEPERFYHLQASQEGYISATETAALYKGETVTVSFALEPKPKPGTITGRVSSAPDDAPTAGAEVRTMIEGIPARTTTDEAGRYDFASVPDGVYQLLASQAGFVSATRTAAVSAGETAAADFVLAPKPTPEPPPEPGTITGRISSAADDAPIAGAEVRTVIDEIPAQTTSDEAGGYDFATVPDGVYLLQASKAGFVSATRTAAVSEGKTAAVDFVLAPEPPPEPPPEPGTITGRISSAADDAPIAGAEVRTVIDEIPAQTTSGEAGGYGFAKVPEGVYLLQASHPDYLSDTQTVAVHEGKPTAADFALVWRASREATLGILVVDEALATPIPSALVTLYATDGGVIAEKTTSDTGEVTFQTAESPEVFQGGDYEVRVSADRYEAQSVLVTDLSADLTRTVGLIAQPLPASLRVAADATAGETESAYAERQAARMEAMDALETTVGTSKAYRNARSFLSEVLGDPARTPEKVTDACQDTLKSLSSAIVRVDAKRQAALREAVVLVDAGCLDRVSFFQPRELSPRVETALRTLGDLTRKTGVTTDQVLAAWHGDRLAKELGVTSASVIRKTFGETV